VHRTRALSINRRGFPGHDRDMVCAPGLLTTPPAQAKRGAISPRAARAGCTSGVTLLPPRAGAFGALSRGRVAQRRGLCPPQALLTPWEGSKKADKAREGLLQAVFEAVMRDVIPGYVDLVEPWLQGPAAPLKDVVEPEELADPDSCFVQAGGVRLHYKEVGAGGGGRPAVVLLHGFNGSTFSWREVMTPISEGLGGARVVAFDRPPFGLSERPVEPWEGPNPYSNGQGAKFTLALMDALGLEEAVLVGHSAGCPVAAEVAIMSPDRVSSIFFASPALSPPQDPPRGLGSADLGTQLRFIYIRALLENQDAGLHYIRKQILKCV